MTARLLSLCLLLGLGASLPAAPQARTLNERLVELADVLGNGSVYPSEARIRAIREIAELRAISAMAAGLLFDRANAQYESSPAVREAAALALRHVCDLHNRLYSLRLCRIANAAREPDPRVRIAALQSLAAFETADAAAGVYDATEEAKEPDPQVREAAKDLIRRGLVGSLY